MDRPIDDVGRVSIPIEIRKKMKVNIGDQVEFEKITETEYKIKKLNKNKENLKNLVYMATKNQKITYNFNHILTLKEENMIRGLQLINSDECKELITLIKSGYYD